MELGVSTDVSPARDEGSLRLCTDSLPETDDSLLCDAGTAVSGGKTEGDKGRRRSSPARSRIKQVRRCPASCHCQRYTLVSLISSTWLKILAS